MSISTNKSEQPYKYNGKQFEQMNGYDVYKFEFRDYYATTARFTTPDPLADNTPHKSPYAYANNNFINETDILGLFGRGSFSNAVRPNNYIVIDRNGYMLGGVNDGDRSIYLDEDGEWKDTDGKGGLKKVGWMIWWHNYYFKNFYISNGHWRVPGFFMDKLPFQLVVSLISGWGKV